MYLDTNYDSLLLELQSGFPHDENRIACLALGLAGESGEAVEHIKKLLRDGSFNNERAFIKELGDVLAYITLLANEFGYDLEEVATLNIEKLTERKNRGTLQGSGDDR